MQTTLSKNHFWIWQEYKIHYVQAGERIAGLPPLILVHGFGASTDHWRKNIEDLQKDFEVWAIDLLGFGRSEKPNIDYSGEIWQNQLADFILDVVGKPAILAGNSLGGYASLCVAAQVPDSVVGLILLNSAGPFSETDPREQSSNPLKAVLSKSVRFLLSQSWATRLLFEYTRNRSNIRKTLEKVYLNKSAVTDELIEDIYRPSCDPGAADVFASVFKNPQGSKVDILLKQMSCPLLMIWGEGDPWMQARKRGAMFRQYYPELTEHYLQAGHCPHDEVPQQVDSLINNWIGQNFPVE